MESACICLCFFNIGRVDWNKYRVTIGSCGRVRCEPAWRLDWNTSWLKDFDLWLVWAGSGRLRLTEGQEVELRPGACFWMRPGRTYVGRHDPVDRLGATFIHFDLRDSRDRRLSAAQLPPEQLQVRDFAYLDAATRHVVELVRSREESRRFEAETLLLSLLAGLAGATAEQLGESITPAAAENRRKIQQIVALIAERPAEVPPVAELARKFGYSPVHFSRVFSQIMGEPPREYIVNARLQRARQLLRESNLSIGEIADMLGYPDIYFFSRQFREKCGKTPTEYRARRGR